MTRCSTVWSAVFRRCAGEKYAGYVLGNIDDLNSLDPEKLYEVYKDIIRSSPLISLLLAMWILKRLQSL